MSWALQTRQLLALKKQRVTDRFHFKLGKQITSVLEKQQNKKNKTKSFSKVFRCSLKDRFYHGNQHQTQGVDEGDRQVWSPWAVQAMGLAADSLMNYLALARI